ncbi:beta-lactamase/transpeptidase-like protein [Aspergillus campestris IBT 28561]|uniref:Beta-lactamase/transpeptidase-like protein n=1 Tax=Aspergillus campestris (strain IBT 28561) TaxID=1392248 RepID=A0A2I1D7D1_ASPC2|nr:beta-lactamase/transpeptidase-like protein [Aspergillus campestris IBT 28561]PKY05768.1 beta-lactamase/transpeptidase-like protein [Aspergillus campestris IBT 28561]
MAHLIGADPFNSGFDALVEEQLARWHIPGISIGVVNGHKNYFKQYGFARLPDKPMRAHTLFPTSGTTKSFTAAIMATVIDDPRKVRDDLSNVRGPVQWNTPIATRIPAHFVLSDEHATTVTTIEDALSHRSGLPNLQLAEALRNPALIIEDLVRLLRHIPLAPDPDHRRFEYSNESYQVISHLLQRVTETPLEDLLRTEIWRPLNMDSTYFSIDDVKLSQNPVDRLVQGYTWNERSRQYIPEDYRYCAATSGAGAMVSSATDYAKWLRCLLFESSPLSPAVHRAIKFPRIIVERGTAFDHFLTPEQSYHLYTLGWFLDSYRGWYSVHSFLLDRRLGVANPANSMIRFVDKAMREASQKAPNHLARVEHPLPPSLPLDQYGGTYQHPGFGKITLTGKNGALHSDLTDRICRSLIRLNPLSGEFFIAKQSTVSGRWASFDSALVEFEVGLEGIAERMAIHSPTFPGKKVWFARMEEGPFRYHHR